MTFKGFLGVSFRHLGREKVSGEKLDGRADEKVTDGKLPVAGWRGKRESG